MKKLHILKLLMVMAIIAVTAFQGYWLRENYQREKTNLELIAGTTFNETIFSLQARNLSLSSFNPDSTRHYNFEFREEAGPEIKIRVEEGEELAGYVNMINSRIYDSINDPVKIRKNLKISMNNPGIKFQMDSIKDVRVTTQKLPDNRILRFLYSVDSLQVSFHVATIDSVYRHAMQKKKIKIPFSVLKTDADKTMNIEMDPMKVRVGLAHPVVYQLKLGNTFSFIIRQLAKPALFSLFLVGITLLSFIMLYRNLQRQRRLAAIKNEFISNMTHELKTPIATVGVAIEALRNFNAISDPKRTKEYLDISQNELHRLSLLVDKVLKLSMFEKKEIELKVELVNLKELVEEVVSSMKLQIEKHHAIVAVSTTGNSQLQGDRMHLLSVVFNLLDNALKYGNGNIKVNIDLKENENDVKLIVADNGIGIPREYRDKLFEKFFRVPAGDTHNAKGYGLGLSYVAQVVERHYGKIEVESQEGAGTKFIITFPKAPTA